MTPEYFSGPPQDAREVSKSKRLNLNEIKQADRLCSDQEFVDKYLYLKLEKVKSLKDPHTSRTVIAGQFEGGNLTLYIDADRLLSSYSGHGATYDEIHRFTFDEETELIDYFSSALKKRDRLKKKLEKQLKEQILPVAIVRKNTKK